jgi:phytoene dehydrogenase-like protein
LKQAGAHPSTLLRFQIVSDFTNDPQAQNAHDADAIVVGSGPNGLAAAVTLADAGRRVRVLEAQPTIGGGARSSALTLPGFIHDLGSAIHPMAVGSPFFQHAALEAHGLTWIHPEFPLAHPLDDGSAAVLHRSLPATCDAFGKDGKAWRNLMAPFVENWASLAAEILQPMLHLPRHPLRLARFGLLALQPAAALARRHFHGDAAQALFAGLAGHSFLSFDAPGSAAVALVLGAAGHAVGWPLPRGGAQSIADALAARLRARGGEIETACPVNDVRDLPRSGAMLLDLTVWEAARVAAGVLPARYRKKLERFRHGPGIFKVDYALDAPIPWTAEECRRAGTVHLGGGLAEVAHAEAQVARGEVPQSPFVLLAQPSLFDPTRAPAGKHVAWAYCHIPFGCPADMTSAIEAQIERFAPGFRERILASHVSPPATLAAENANLAGGDITGGAVDLWQLLARPVLSLDPYRMPALGLYLCSSSTPPAGGVHGMCGYNAARSALRREWR